MKKIISLLFAILLIASCLPTVIFADEAVGFIAYNTGNNANDGLSAAKAKKSIGGASGNGVFSLVKDGGTVVVSEKMYFGSNYTWNANGPTVITANYGGVDYKNTEPAANPASGVIKAKAGTVITIASDVTLDDIILHSENGKEKIVIAPGATFTVTESVLTTTTTDTYFTLEVQKGGKAIINGGTFAAISGDGEYVLGDKAKIGKGGKFDRNGVVGFLSNTTGSNNYDGFSEATPKSGLGQVDGNGIVGVVAQGGTVVVCGKMYVSNNFAWSTAGKVIITGSFEGKDYKDPEPANNPEFGVFRMKPGTTFTVGSDLVFDDIIIFQDGAQCNIVVSPGATLTINESVITTTNSDTYMNIFVSKGANAVINGGTFASVSGEGRFRIGEKATVLQDKASVKENIPLRTSASVCYLDNANGNNEASGESADKAVKTYAAGLFKRISGGGTVVVSGGSVVGGAPYNMTQQLTPLTFTSNYGGIDYKDADKCAYRFSNGTTMVITSDVIFDDIILMEDEGNATTIKVTNNATLTVTDKAVFSSKKASGAHYTVILEKGTFAILSKEAQKHLKIQGEGTVITYEKGNADIFKHYLGTDIELP
ncbi:MAG: hypothetical protein E7619_03630 [Ruminococcaceae bacterium]|nr:hypothetical protein [Oscillospiraceae bacterium]